MAAKKKILLAAGLAVALVGTLWVGGDRLWTTEPEIPRGDRHAATSERGASESDAVREAASTATGTALTVIVRNLRGQPLANAEVTIQAAGEAPRHGILPPEVHRRWLAMMRAAPRPMARTTTDRNGRALLRDLPGGQWDIWATYPGCARVSRSIPWWSRDATPDPVVILLGPGRKLAGRVLDDAGNPVPGAVVVSGSASLPMMRGAGAWPARTLAGEGGRYEFAALPAEDLSIWAAVPGGTPHYVAILRFPGVELFDIHLRNGGVVAGTVTLDGTGEALSGVTVVAGVSAVPYADLASAVTDKQGCYRIDCLPPCSLGRLHAWKRGYVQVFERRSYGPLERDDTLDADLAMQPGARLRGRVLGPDGPVGTAAVNTSCLRLDGGMLHRASQVEEDGWFVLEDLPPGRHVLQVSAPGWVQPGVGERAWSHLQDGTDDAEFVVTLSPGADATRDLHVVRGRLTIEGWVEGPDGRPFAGARVTVGWQGSESAEDGSFTLRGVQPGPFSDTVAASAKGFRQATPAPRLPGDVDRVTDLRLRLEKAPRVLGMVQDEDGNPVPDASVLAANGPHPDNPEAHKRSHIRRMWYGASRIPVDDRGRFELDLISPWGTYVRATAPGHAECAPVEAEPGREITLVVGAARPLRGLVTVAGGPVRGAWIRLWSPGLPPPHQNEGTDYSPRARVAAVTDDRGVFSVPDMGLARWEVEASAPGYVAATVIGVAGQEVAIELQRTLSIAGRVVFSDRRPAKGARVYCYQIDDKGKLVPGQRRWRDDPTDMNGRFTLEELEPGLYCVRVQGGGKDNPVGTKVQPVEAGATDVRIVVQRGMSIEGRLVTRDGIALPVVNVSARGVGHEGYGFGQTGTDGAFEVRGLQPGIYALTFTKQDEHRSSFKRYRIAAGTAGLQLVWGSEGEPDATELATQMRGRLVDERGRPLANARVSAQPQGAESGRIARTDSEGRFTLERLEPGRYRMFVKADGYLRDLKTTLETGSRGATLVARRGLSIRGVVHDEDGQALRGVRVVARAEKRLGDAKSGAGGEFEIGGLPKAQCSLQAWKKGYVVWMKEGVHAGTRNMVIVMMRGLKVSGTLRDAQGAPLPNTLILFLGIEDPGQRSFAKTSVGGRFEAGGLLPGRYRVLAKIEDDDRPCGTVDAGATDVELVASE